MLAHLIPWQPLEMEKDWGFFFCAFLHQVNLNPKISREGSTSGGPDTYQWGVCPLQYDRLSLVYELQSLIISLTSNSTTNISKHFVSVFLLSRISKVNLARMKLVDGNFASHTFRMPFCFCFSPLPDSLKDSDMSSCVTGRKQALRIQIPVGVDEWNWMRLWSPMR